MHMLHHIRRFRACMGTTQRPSRTHKNLADLPTGTGPCLRPTTLARAGSILFGMDLDGEVGRHSRTAASDRATKAKNC